MAQMHGRYFFTGMENVKGYFAFDIAPVHEIEHPFRVCKHAVYIHVWPGKALVLGWWRKGKELEQHLLDAMGGRVHVQTEKSGISKWFQSDGLQQSSSEAFEAFRKGADESARPVSDRSDYHSLCVSA